MAHQSEATAPPICVAGRRSPVGIAECVDRVIQIVENIAIGPTLGMQGIGRGWAACRLLVSILFMIIFYKSLV